MNINNHNIIILLVIRNILIFSTVGLLLFIISSNLIYAEELYSDQSEFTTETFDYSTDYEKTDLKSMKSNNNNNENKDTYPNNTGEQQPNYFNPQTDSIDETIAQTNQQINDSNCELLHDSNNLRMIDIMLSNTGVLNPSCMNELNNSLIHYTVKGIIQDRYILLETR